MKKNRNEFSLLSVLLLPFKENLIISLFHLLLVLSVGFLEPLLIVFRQRFIDKTLQGYQEHKGFNTIIEPLIVICIILFVQQSYPVVEKILSKLTLFKLKVSIQKLFLDKHSKLSYFYIEDKESYDLIKRVNEGPEEKIMTHFSTVLHLISAFIRIIGIIIIIVRAGISIALIFAIGSIPGYILSYISGKAQYDIKRKTTEYMRKSDYIASLLRNRENAAERILFQFSSYLNGKWKKVYKSAKRKVIKVELVSWIHNNIGLIWQHSINTIILIMLIKPLKENVITMGYYVSVLTAIYTLRDFIFTTLSQTIINLKNCSEYIGEMKEFLEYDEHDRGVNQYIDDGTEPIVRFENVYFRYPNTDVDVLKNITFELGRGEQVALVGRNGAGKSTIVKLMLGLYKPDRGAITINNIPNYLYSKEDISKIFAVVFQDFSKYQTTFENNIYFGEINNPNKYKLNDIVKIVGMERIFSKMPSNEKTHLGKELDNGVDLSYGEWQKVALARCVASGGYIRILDEPTSALDPLAESDLYKKFQILTENRTTLLISHRLGSTKIANKIIVLNKGQIEECGTHNELMALRNLYYQMFQTQRNWYLKKDERGDLENA